IGGDQEWRGDPQTHGLRLPRRRTRRTHPTLLQRALQPLSELPSSLRASRGRSRRERPQTLLLPALSDASGDAAGPASARTVLAPWAHRRRLTTHRRGGQRYRSRPAYAAGQTQTLRAVAACGLRKKMKLAAARAVEMTVAAKPCGFRPHLGNRCAIPTFPPPRRLLDCFLNSTPERSFPQPSAQASFRLILVLEKTPCNDLRHRPALQVKLPGLLLAEAIGTVVSHGQAIEIVHGRRPLSLTQHGEHRRDVQVAENLIASDFVHCHLTEVAHRLTIAARDSEHSLLAVFLGVIGFASSQHQARGHALYVPFPRSTDGFVEVVDVENEPSVRASISSQVANVRVAANLRVNAGVRKLGEVRGHHRNGPAKEPEGRSCHACELDGQELGEAAALRFP